MEQFGQDPIIPEMQPQDQLAQQHQSAQQQFEQQQQYEQQQQFAQQQFEQQQFEQQQYEQQQFAQQQQQYAQPQYAQPGYAQPAYAAPASPAVKKKSPFGWISMFVGLLCVVVAGLGTVKALNTSFFNIPAIETLFNISGGQEVLDKYDEFVDEAEEAARLLSDEELEEIEDEVGISADDVIDVLRKPSVNSIMEVSNVAEEFIPDYGDEIVSILGVVRPIIIGYGGLIMLLALLAALFRNRTLSVIGVIVSLAFFLLLAGTAYLIMYVAVAIAHFVLVTIHKNLVKKY